jgi:hypothetical protein
MPPRKKKLTLIRPDKFTEADLHYARIGFEAAHPKTELRFEKFDGENLRVWVRIGRAIAQAVREREFSGKRQAA